MKNYFIISTVCLALVACGAKEPAAPNAPETSGKVAAPKAVSFADLTPTNFRPTLLQNSGLRNGMTMDEAKAKIDAVFGEPPVEGKYSRSEEVIYKSGGLTHIFMTHEGLADDSLQGQQVILVFKPVTPERAELINYGMRLKCWRGPDAGTWQKAICK